MSRCKACDVILNEHEMRRVDHHSGLYLDMCNVCASHSNDALKESYDYYESGPEEYIEKEFDSAVDIDYNT
jgi:GH35 family endo-1,4-beta-xylanase